MIDTKLRNRVPHDFVSEYMALLIFEKDGVNTEVEVPELFYNIHQNIFFLEKNNINTVQDFLDWLNSKGYNRRIATELSIYGYSYIETKWVWNDGDTSLPMIGTRVNKSNFPSAEKDVRYRTIEYTREGGATVFVFDEVPVLDWGRTARWRREVQSYRFTPDRFDHLALPKERTNMYFGMEVELSSALSAEEVQYIVTRLEPKQAPFFYFKHDGSIQDNTHRNAFEIVTMPCSPRYLRKAWRIFFDKVEKHLGPVSDYFSTDRSCGVHIHVSSDSFMDSYHNRKFIAIWNQFDPSNYEFIQKVAKRQFNRYCNTHENYIGRTLARRMNKFDRIAMSPNGSDNRYASCRQTYETTEVRVFKGGFNLDHLLYCIEAMQAMHDFSYKVPLRDISSPRFIGRFKGWLESQNRYRKLQKEIA